MRRHGSAALFARSRRRRRGTRERRRPARRVRRMASRTCGIRRRSSYRTDGGPLSATVTEQAARTRVQNMFNVWQNVGSASISYSRVGFIIDVGAFTDGDVSTAVEYDAVDGACGSSAQNPDHLRRGRRDLHRARRRRRLQSSASPVPARSTRAQGRILTGSAMMNGLYQDGQATPIADLTAAEFDATFIHEFGHFSGLDHSQINVECGFGTAACGQPRRTADDVPFPRERRAGLAIDRRRRLDLEALPGAGGGSFAATHGTITGTVFFSDGESHAQLVNVVARRVDNGGAPANESRTTGRLRRLRQPVPRLQGNPINEPSDQPTRAVRQRRRRRHRLLRNPAAARQLHDRSRINRSRSSSRARASAATSASTCRAQRRAERSHHRHGRQANRGQRRHTHQFAPALRPFEGP